VRDGNAAPKELDSRFCSYFSYGHTVDGATFPNFAVAHQGPLHPPTAWRVLKRAHGLTTS